jgi:hypothetical protein
VISIQDQDYDPKKWWTSSNGVMTVLMETIAYLYTVLFFTMTVTTKNSDFGV